MQFVNDAERIRLPLSRVIDCVDCRRLNKLYVV